MGAPGHEWRWATNATSAVPEGALLTQHTENPNAAFDESWESLFLERNLPQHSCKVQVSRLFQLPMPVFCGASLETLAPLWPVSLSNPHLKQLVLDFDGTTGAAADQSVLQGVNVDASDTAGFAGAEGFLQQQVAPAADTAAEHSAAVAATVQKHGAEYAHTAASGAVDAADIVQADAAALAEGVHAAAKHAVDDAHAAVEQAAEAVANELPAEQHSEASVSGTGGSPNVPLVPELHVTAPAAAVKEVVADAESQAQKAEHAARYWGSAAATTVSTLQFPAVLPAAYTLPRASAAAALAAATGTVSAVAAAAKHWLKLEVLIDFAQVLSLFIANLSSEAMRDAEAVFGRATAFLALDWNVAFPKLTDYPLYLYGGLGVLAMLILLVYLWVMSLTRALHADELRQGREAMGWDKLRKVHPWRLWWIEKVLTVSFVAYLPVSRTAMQVLVCAPSIGRAMQALGAGVSCTKHAVDDTYQCNCTDWEYYTEFSIFMGLVLLLFTFGLPLRTYQLIQANKPVGSREHPSMRYDDQGSLVPYTDEMYERDLQTDPKQIASPYRSLYMPYTRKAAHWKVITLMMKLVLTLAVVVMHTNLITQSSISIAVLAVMSVLGYRLSPFLNDAADRMDLSGRVTNLLTVTFGLIGSMRLSDSQRTIDLAGLGINVVNGINAGIMFLLLLWGIPFVRRLTQSVFGFLLFENASTNHTGRLKHTILNRKGQVSVDLRRELKLRVWQPFWDGVMAHGVNEAVSKRFVQLQRAASDAGRERIVEHFYYAGRHAQDRIFIMNELEGVDAYWDGADGAQSSSCFGKATVSLFPFHVTFAYDEDERVAFIWEKDLHRFVVLNKTPDVQRRRGVRECLRSASYGGIKLHLHHTERRSYTLPDGTETYTDSNGNKQTRTVYSTITVTLTFKRCSVNIRQADAKQMSRGFDWNVAFADGSGSGVLPRTGQRKYFNNETTTLSPNYLGFSIKFEVQGRMAKELITRSENRAIFKTSLPQWRNHCKAYRSKAWVSARDEEAVLSSAFWLYVYDQPQLTPSGLKIYLETWERNRELSAGAFMGKHGPGIEFVAARMQVLSAHPCNALWYCFWESVWQCNRGLGIVESNAQLLDVNRSTALAYRPVPRDELEQKLQGSGLLGSCGRFVCGSSLQALYGAMQDLHDRFRREGNSAWAPAAANKGGKGAAPAPRERAFSPHRRAGAAAPSLASSELTPLLGASAGVGGAAAGDAKRPLLASQ